MGGAVEINERRERVERRENLESLDCLCHSGPAALEMMTEAPGIARFAPGLARELAAGFAPEGGE